MSFDTNQIDHFDLCSSFYIRAESCNNTNTATHPGLELITYSKGAFQEQIGNQYFKPFGKNILVYNAEKEHTEIYSGNSQALAIVVEPKFVTSLLSEFNADTQQYDFTNPIFNVDDSTLDSINEVFGYRGVLGISKFSFECALTEICIAIFLNHKSSISNKILRAKSSSYPMVSKKVARLIYSHRFEPNFNLDALAEMAGVSKFHLIRTFKQNYGMSPHKFLNLLRLDSIKMRLATSDESITAIALNAGYEDISTFYKQFKKSAGISPKSFRQRQQQFFPCFCLRNKILNKRFL